MLRTQNQTTIGVRFALSLFTIVALGIAALANAAPATALRNNLDPSFVTQVSGSVFKVVVQPDGKILVAGDLGSINGGGGGSIVRLNPDGSTDTSFAASIYKWVTDVDLLPNGKMYVAFNRGFPEFGSHDPQVQRLNADGTVDSSFTLPALLQEEGSSVNIEPLPDGRLYVAANFANPPTGPPRWQRLLNDGSFDPGFTVGGKYVDQVRAVDAQGRTYFSDLLRSDGTREPLPLVRLLLNDTLDPNFNPPALSFDDFEVFPQANGGVLISGYTTSSRTEQVVRLLSNGSRDPNFSFAPISDTYCCSPLSVRPLADGRFLIGPRQRFLATGAPDPSFEPFPIYSNRGITAIAEQPDGKLLFGGQFDEVGVPSRAGVVRLLADTSPTPSGPVACEVRRYQGDGTGSWGDTRRTFYEAGTTFTLQTRSSSGARAIVFAEANAVTTLSSLGSRYTAPRLTEYDVGFSSATANIYTEWVDVNICGPARATPTPTPTPSPTPAPTCAIKRYTGDGTGSWGKYGRATYSGGTTFTLIKRSSSAVRGMVFVDANAIHYLMSIGDSYSAPQQVAYNVGFNSTTANTSSQWVEIKICTPGSAPLAVEQMRSDELPEPSATNNRIFLPFVQGSRE